MTRPNESKSSEMLQPLRPYQRSKKKELLKKSDDVKDSSSGCSVDAVVYVRDTKQKRKVRSFCIPLTIHLKLTKTKTFSVIITLLDSLVKGCRGHLKFLTEFQELSFYLRMVQDTVKQFAANQNFGFVCWLWRSFHCSNSGLLPWKSYFKPECIFCEIFVFFLSTVEWFGSVTLFPIN